MSHENVEIVRRALEAFRVGDVDGALAFAHPDLVSRRVDPDGAVVHGHDGFLQLFADWTEGFTDFSFRPDAYADAGDRVLVQMRQWGRGVGSGVLVEGDYWLVFALEDGLVTRFDIYSDKGQALAAAGLPA
ncbi:MAG: nuclear transport factor 2 family protein [Thermoleophilaceae bacterium]